MRAALLALALAACALSSACLRVWWPALEALLGARLLWLVAAQVAAALACLAAARLARGEPAMDFTACARVLLTGLGLGWSIFLLVVPGYHRLWLELACGPVAGIVALVLLFELRSARWSARSAKLARAGLVAFALAPLLLEGSLRILASARPAALLARSDESPGRVLERNRRPHGSPRFGMSCNSGGHFDEEFRRRAPGETRVALIGDSFSQGVVPHALHYSTVAERALGHPVDNFGISGIGPLEYEELLLSEVLPLDPSAVVVAFFVGNDFEMPPEEPVADPGLASWLDRRRVLVCLVPARLARLVRERRLNPGGIAGAGPEQARADPTSSLAERYPWLDDPAQEPPSISEEGFLALERQRARLACGSKDEELLRAARVVERMRDACGSRPFAVLLVPDEFQVEDGLWEALGTEGLLRDRPQALLLGEFRAKGIPVLDLLPAMRAVAPMGDGRRHLYHLRDTHWNVRGNRVAGLALAPFLAELLAGRR